MDQGRADIFEIARDAEAGVNAGGTENLNQGSEAERDAEAGVWGEQATELDTPAVDCSRRTFSRKRYAYYTPTMLQDILHYISHGW